MTQGQYLAQALEELFTSSTPGWFTPFMAVLDGLSASQAAKVPAERFNSIWGVVNHVRLWQEAALRQLQNLPVDYAELGSEDGSGWPPCSDPASEAEWQATCTRVREANRALAQFVSGLSEAELEAPISDTEQWNTRWHLIQSMISHNSYHTCEIISLRHMQGWWFDAL